MPRFFVFIALLIIISCSSPKKGSTSSKQRGDTRIVAVEYIDDETYLLLEASNDRSYAFTESNPVKVGSAPSGSGPKNERRYLNALLGPEGQDIRYFRAGSCCPFKTPNGLIDNTGLLDRYRVFWDGSKDTLDIFINMYDEGDLRIPVGFTAKNEN
jgi:hypothetical protein